MVNTDKLNFLKNDFISHLKKLNGTETPLWGKMNAQQMIEHMGDAFRWASGKDNLTILTPAERLPATYAFMMSEKDFKPETKNALMSETPSPVRTASMEKAVERIENKIAEFENFWKDKSETEKIVNPFFGNLNFEEQVQLLHKHSLHHLRQFGLI